MFRYRYRHPGSSMWRYDVATSLESLEYARRVFKAWSFPFEAI